MEEIIESTNDKCLRLACKNGMTGFVKLLLLDPSVHRDDKQYLLDVALECTQDDNLVSKKNEKIEIVEILLSKLGVDEDLEIADIVSYDNSVVLKYVIDSPDLELRDLFNHSELAGCVLGICRSGIKEMVELILDDKRVKKEKVCQEIFKRATVLNSNVRMLAQLKFFLSIPSIDPGVMNNYPIRIASELGRVDIVKLLLKEDWVDPSDLNNEAIKSAHEKGHKQIVKLLLADKRLKKDEFVKRLLKN